MELKYFDFYGLKISTFSLRKFNDYVKYKILQNQKSIIYGYSLGSIIYAKKIPEIILGNNADVSIIDGQGLYYLIKLLNFKAESDLSIPNCVTEILKIANQNSFSLMLYGSDSENNRKASVNIKKEFPSIDVLPGLEGFNNEIDRCLKVIDKFKPNVLLIGISSPMKEIIAFKFRDKISANIIVPCGGMIDVLAGKIKKSNWVIKKLGLASLARVLQEPTRLYKRYSFFYFNVFFIFFPKFFYSLVFKKGQFTIPQILNIKEIKL